MKRIGVWLLALLLVLGGAAAQATQAQPGAGDPLPGLREQGQVIAWQEITEEPRLFPVPLRGMAQVADWLQAEGPVSRTYYLRDGTARWVEVVYRRQRDTLEREGFEIRAAGFALERGGTGIGSRRWLDTYLAVHPLPAGTPGGPAATVEGQGVILASREQAEGVLWAVVSILQPAEGQIGVLVDLVQTARTTPPPPIGSGALSVGLSQRGRAVLDGLVFTEGGGLDPASEPVLATLGRYLRENVRQTFRLVGHSADSGDLAAAALLSQAQAEAVVTALVDRHGATRERLRAFGVGPLSPLFPNDTAAGRARNQRVELVAGP
ncbi:MAG: OmpA family protein [Pararhodobacter sp.]